METKNQKLENVVFFILENVALLLTVSVFAMAFYLGIHG